MVENSSGKHKGQTTISRRDRKRLRYLVFEVTMSLVGKKPEFGALHQYDTTRKVTCAILRDWKNKKTTFEEKGVEYTEI